MNKAIALTTAELTFNAEGAPYSAEFDDIYHPAAGATGQARHVFLGGNGLPSRWRGRECFTVLETGFGLGLNFLETWRAFEDDPQACARLHFVSVENRPLSRTELAPLLARWPEHAARARKLVERWPLPLAGFHRLHFGAGRVTLTLLFGDAAELLPQLVARVDAFYLDGFSPAKNPALWSPAVFAELARLAAPGATTSSWTVAVAVQEGLRAVGFAVEKRAGYGGKRDMLAGARRDGDVQRAVSQGIKQKRAVIIGAGLAGTSCAERLAARGWSVDILERQDAPARAASGNPLGLATPLLNLADSVNARLSRAAFLYALRHFAALERAGAEVAEISSSLHEPGVLRIARDERDAARFETLLRTLACPPALARFADTVEGTHLAGWPVARPGMWFPEGTAVDPVKVCDANLTRFDAQRIRLRTGVRIDALVSGDEGWQLLGPQGVVAQAPVVVLAAGAEMLSLAQARPLRLERIRGQITLLPADPRRRLAASVTGDRHAITLPDGRIMIGATFQPGDEDATVRDIDHAENLAGMNALLPGFCDGLAPHSLQGRTAFRAATPDRMPVFGAWADAQDAAFPLYVASGLGARGLVWAPLGAELLASQITDEPWPVAMELADAVSPLRFRNSKR